MGPTAASSLWPEIAAVGRHKSVVAIGRHKSVNMCNTEQRMSKTHVQLLFSKYLFNYSNGSDGRLFNGHYVCWEKPYQHEAYHNQVPVKPEISGREK